MKAVLLSLHPPPLADPEINASSKQTNVVPRASMARGKRDVVWLRARLLSGALRNPSGKDV